MLLVAGGNGGFVKLVDKHSAALGFVGLGLTFAGGPLLTILAVLISVITAVATFILISTMVTGTCPPLLVDTYVALLAVLTVVGAIFGKGLGGIIGFWFGAFLGGGAIAGILKTPYCKNG
ncbi:MAG: hypothetical protein GY787_01140 [Alteromonadales bacterium]|nr:hypothetical protein [Alteromonadales bacterium]MCP4985033.1 hypothetical protein [Colwellia sp.]